MTTRQNKPNQGTVIPNHENPEKHFVQHNYHDHLYDSVVVEAATDTNGVQKLRVHRGGVATPFPEKLHYMLSQVDYEGLSNIVSWQPHGRCFIVRNPKEFVEQIMPRFFKQTKLTSFQRQLNLYGFSRLTAGTDRGGYYHELFIRGRMDLCSRMTRTRVKGNGSKGASSPETEPNFYSMTPCSEIPRVMSEDIKLDTIANIFAVIPEDNLEQESDETAIGLPIEIQVSSTESQITEASSADDNVSKMSSSSAASPPWSSPEATLSSPPIVSPVSRARTTISTSDSQAQEAFPNMPIPTEVSVLDYQFDLHSGDMLLFEGLPFHYLETKDVEDSLLIDTGVV